MIDLKLLGTGAMMPLAGRWLSSLLVRCGGELILFDCGEGTQIPWRSSGWGFRATSAICLSHLHADHVGGLPGVLHSLANSDRSEGIRIFGPVGTMDVVSGLRSIAPDLPFPVSVIELGDSERFSLPGGITGSVIASIHRVPGLIYRLDLPRGRRFNRGAAETLGIPQTSWSRLVAGVPVTVGGLQIEPEQVLGPPRRGLAIGFMTDTRPVPGAATFLQDVDLLVSEGTYGDSELQPKALDHKHMTFAEAATIARDANAKRLWLTHFSPAMLEPGIFIDEARHIFPQVELGFDGMESVLRYADDD